MAKRKSQESPTIHPPPADIHLEPHDWYLANWRNLPPLPKGSAAPFDRDACCKRLSKLKVNKSGSWSWSSAKIPQWITVEEGVFWLTCFLRSKNAKSSDDLVNKLPQEMPTPETNTLIQDLNQCTNAHVGELCPILFAIYPTQALAQFLCDLRVSETLLLPAFRCTIRPYLSEADRQIFREVLGVKLAAYPRFAGCFPINLAGMAASVGMPKEIEELLSSLGHSRSWDKNQHRMLQLGMERATVAKIPDYRFWMTVHSEFLRGLIAHLEEDAITALEQAYQHENRENTEKVIQELGRIHRPSLAPLLFRWCAERQSVEARTWLDAHPELALAGMREHLHEEKTLPTFIEYLRGLIRTGKQSLVEEFLNATPKATGERIREHLETTVAGLEVASSGVPDWFPPSSESKLPKWLDVAVLAPILVQAKPLPASCVAAIVAALIESTLEQPASLIGLLRKHAEPRSLDSFALSVLDRWLAASGKYSDRWAITALGLLGGDGACLRLEKELPNWATQRANVGVDCLLQINSEQSLATLFALTRLKWPPSGTLSALYRLQKQHGFTDEQLEDVAVPRLGLHQEPKITIGKQRYRLSISPELNPCLLDERHTRLGELPQMQANNDPHETELARVQWSAFRDRVHEIIPAQRLRLEVAMRYQRRWSGDFFRNRVMNHPLLGHLVRAIVWGVFDENRLIHSFRATRNQCVDIASTPLEIAPDAIVGIVHPTHLAPEVRMIWGDVLAENDLTPPFVQLAREPFVVPKEEQVKKETMRFAGRVVEAGPLVTFLRKRGWQGQRYSTPRVWRYFPVSQQYACIQVQGDAYETNIHLDNDYGPKEVTLSVCFISRQVEGKTAFLHGPAHRLSLGEADAQVYDEMIRTIEELP